MQTRHVAGASVARKRIAGRGGFGFVGAMLLLVLCCSVAVIVSFPCSVAEAVLLSLNPIRLETLKNGGTRFAAAWLRMKQNVGRPIALGLVTLEDSRQRGHGAGR